MEFAKDTVITYRKKTLHILVYSLASGGAERVVSILLERLGGIYNVTLVLMSNDIFYPIPKNVNIIFLEQSSPFEFKLAKLFKLPILGWKYKKLLKQSSCDISLSFMNRPNYINIFAKLFGSHAKAVISERIAPSREYPSNSFKDIVSRFLIRFLYPKANLIIPNAKGIEHDLVALFGICRSNIQTIHNPLSLTIWPKGKQDNAMFTVVTVGRLQKQKNHTLLISAFAKLTSKKIQLIIIGEGELKSELKQQIASLNLTSNIHLLGRKNNPQDYLAQADAFVFSSNYEGFPNVLLEALACSLPIISTDCKSGPREILAPSTDFTKQVQDEIERAEYGILTPTNNVEKMTEAIELLIEDKALRQSYADKAQNRAKDFEADKIIEQYIEAIESV